MVLHKRRYGDTDVPVFHIRYRKLIIICSLCGLHMKAIDRIFPSLFIRIPLRIWTTCIHLHMSMIFYSSLIATISMKGEIFHKIHSVLTLSCSIHGAIRQYYMHWKMKQFDEMYVTWDKMFTHDDDAVEREIPPLSAVTADDIRGIISKLIDRYYKKSLRTLIITTILSAFSLTSFAATSYFEPSKKIRLPNSFPYRHQSPDFEFLITFFTLGIFWHTLAVGTSQTLLFLPLYWEIGELQRLKLKLKNILHNAQSQDMVTHNADKEEGISAKVYTAAAVEDIRKNLNIWIQQHIKLTEFHNLSRAVSNFEYSLEIAFVYMASTMLAVLLSSPHWTTFDKITNASSFSTYFFLFYVLCSCSNYIIDLNASLTEDALAENWSALPNSLKKKLHIILSRTLKPLFYTAFKIYNIDIACFNQVFQTAWSVYNFCLNIVYGN